MENELSLRALFVKERETLNTVRFKEIEDGSADLVVGYLYIKKTALKQLGDPEMVAVQIEPMENT